MHMRVRHDLDINAHNDYVTGIGIAKLMIRKQLLFFTLIFVVEGCAVNPVSGRQELVLLSEREEIALGDRAHQEILDQYGVYNNTALQKYVQDIGDRLAANTHRRNLDYRFTVLDSKEVNAFALPGGYIYITRGLMAYLKSEAELAAILGHEIGHVTARHSVRQYSASTMTGIGLVLGSVLIPGMDRASIELGRLFGTALLRGYGRQHELEADRLGAEYLARANYDPNAMLDVIGILKDQEIFEREQAKKEGREPHIYHGVFSTHPDNDKRLQEVVGTARAFSTSGQKQYVGHGRYMALIDGMVFGGSSSDGFVRGRRFLHPELDFAIILPENWYVKNQQEAIMLTAPNGRAFMQISAVASDKNVSPRDFMIQRFGNLSHDRALKINGLDAHTGVAVVSTEQGPKPARFTVIYFRQLAYIIAGVSKKADERKKFDEIILNTAKSFHQLTPNERQQAVPLRLDVVQADEKTRFADLARSSPLTNAEPQLRLLNGKFPKGEPQKNELLKVIH